MLVVSNKAPSFFNIMMVIINFIARFFRTYDFNIIVILIYIVIGIYQVYCDGSLGLGFYETSSGASVATVAATATFTTGAFNIKVLDHYQKYQSYALKSDNEIFKSFHYKCEHIKSYFYQKVHNRSNIASFEGNIINIMGIFFEFEEKNQSYALLDFYYDPFYLLCVIDSFFKYLGSVNRKGFVPDNYLDTIFVVHIKQHLSSLGYEDKLLANSELTYTMWHNFMFINLYFLLTQKLRFIEEQGSIAFHSLDLDADSIVELTADLESWKVIVFGRLEQFIKVQTQKRGISIIQNTYAGFDTEFEHVTGFHNKLVSVQTAVQRRTIVKVPCVELLDIGYVHPLTSSISDTFTNKVNKHNPHKYTFVDEIRKNSFDFLINKRVNNVEESKDFNDLSLLNNTIKIGIRKVRLLLHHDIDTFNRSLIKSLCELKDLHRVDEFDYYVDSKRHQYVFFLPLTKVDCNIEFPTGKFDFCDLLKMVRRSSGLDCVDVSGTLFNEYYTQNSIVNVFRGGFLPSCDAAFVSIIKMFSQLGIINELHNIFDFYNKSTLKRSSRTKLLLNNKQTISFSIINNTYIIGHYNAADLSLLSDFNDLKHKLSVVNKSFVTLGKPLMFDNTFVYIRDTMLISPGGGKSLDAIGEIYNTNGEYAKLKISSDDIAKMSQILVRDREAFIKYAIRDALITLKHSTEMEMFNRKVKQLGVPITQSSIGRNYVANEWSKNFDQHLPYQISGEFLMGNVDELQTPKGLFATRDVGLYMPHYVANYKGGRNESFMYGIDNDQDWYDYDFASAYTTAMTDLALPDYYNAHLIDADTIEDWTTEQLLSGYLIANCNFKFPSDTKFPSIPCYVDKTTTVYPLSGSALLTGPEILLAMNQGAELTYKSAFFAHQKEIYNPIKEEMEPVKPFFKILKDIQHWRKLYPKGHINNMLYKEIGNGIYGNVCRGISNKMNFDTLTKKSFRVRATNLTNPILASWITAFMRSAVGECLHNINELGGSVVSVTTDGFICNIPNLEKELMKLPKEKIPILLKYRELRSKLSDSHDALEVKHSGKGVISWTTRGQMGIQSTMMAATGFQKKPFDKQELITLFKDTLKSENKLFEITRDSLRSAKDIFNKGGNVIMNRKDQMFRLFHDNRRRFIEAPWMTQTGFFDFSNMLLDSEPLENTSHCKAKRFVSKFAITVPYNKNNSNKNTTTYKSNLEVGVRNFIKAFYSKTYTFGLSGSEFSNSKDIITFISGFKPTKDLKISVSSISKLKNRRLIWRPVPHTMENVEFCAYVKQHLPKFRDDLFMRKPIE